MLYICEVLVVKHNLIINFYEGPWITFAQIRESFIVIPKWYDIYLSSEGDKDWWVGLNHYCTNSLKLGSTITGAAAALSSFFPPSFLGGAYLAKKSLLLFFKERIAGKQSLLSFKNMLINNKQLWIINNITLSILQII